MTNASNLNRRAALAAIASLVTLRPGRAEEADALPLVDVASFFANNAWRPSGGIQVSVLTWKAGVVAVVCGPRGLLPGIEKAIRRDLADIDCVAWSDDRRAFTLFAGEERATIEATMQAALSVPRRRGQYVTLNCDSEALG